MDLGTTLALTVVALFFAAPAYAYIDPGSGSMLVQLLTGGVAGALVLARLYWRRFRDRIAGVRATKPVTQVTDTSLTTRRQ